MGVLPSGTIEIISKFSTRPSLWRVSFRAAALSSKAMYRMFLPELVRFEAKLRASIVFPEPVGPAIRVMLLS